MAAEGESQVEHQDESGILNFSQQAKHSMDVKLAEPGAKA